MATNKQAIIRYNTLDKCFSNNGGKYFIEDLVEACNQALLEFYGIEDGVKKRQIFEDVKFMESDTHIHGLIKQITCLLQLPLL